MKHVLLIEDDAITALVFQRQFAKYGIKVTTVNDGSEGFFRAYKKDYDLILLDVMLPSMDGIGILRRLRAQKDFQAVPIVLCTATDVEKIQREIANDNASLILSKAELSPSHITDKIKDLLQNPATALENSPQISPNAPEVEENILMGEASFASGKPRKDFTVKQSKPQNLPVLRMLAEAI